MSEIGLLPQLDMLTEGLLDPVPFASAYRSGHIVQTKDGELRFSRQFCIALYIKCFRDKAMRLRDFAAINKPFFTLFGGYMSVPTCSMGFPSSDNLCDPVKLMTYYGNHPGFKRNFKYTGELRRALSVPTKRDTFAKQRREIQKSAGMHCFHQLCSTPNAAIQTTVSMPFSLCVTCFDLVQKGQIYDGVSFFRFSALPHPLKNVAFSKWLDRPVLCGLMLVKFVCERYSVPYPKGLSPDALRPLGLLMQQYPHGFNVPKTPEMMLLLNYTMAEMCNLVSLKYFPPKLPSVDAKCMLREADEKGCVMLEELLRISSIMVQKSWCKRSYDFRPSHYIHKMPDGKHYLLSTAFCKLAQLMHAPSTAEAEYTIRVIAEEPSGNKAAVAMDTEWESYKQPQSFAVKCSADGCNMLRDTDFEFCRKCGPRCYAPMCTEPAASPLDNMCEDCGGGLKASITITDAHTCTFQELYSLLRERIAVAAKTKQKKITERKKVVVKRCKAAMPARECMQLSDAYERELQKHPISVHVDIRGCAITQGNPVPQMWQLFLAKTASVEDGPFIQPYVGSAPDSAAFRFLIGTATSPAAPAHIGYSNHYDPMCCTKLKKDEVDAFNAISMPSPCYLVYSQYANVGAAASETVAVVANIKVPDEENDVVLWSDSEEDNPDSKRARIEE